MSLFISLGHLLIIEMLSTSKTLLTFYAVLVLGCMPALGQAYTAKCQSIGILRKYKV